MEAAHAESLDRTRMTWPEIRRSHPDQWVELGDIDEDETTLELRSAVVLGFGPTRRDALATAPPQNGALRSLRYTGRLRSPRPW